MKKINLGFLTLTILITFIGCAFNDDKITTDKQELEDRNNLLKIYKSVEGVYRGEIRYISDNRTVPVEITLYSEEISNGRNSDGETKMQPVLRARYYQADKLSGEASLDAKYIQETGDLALSSKLDERGQPTGGEQIYIRGRLLSSEFNGELRLTDDRTGITDAKIKTKLYSKDLNNRDNSLQKDYYERIRNIYMTVAGEYSLKARPDPRYASAFYATLILKVSDKVVNGIPVPTLRASYQRDGSQIEITTADAVYRYDLDPAELIIDASSNARGEPIRLRGHFINGILQGTILLPRYDATFEATKK